MIPFGAGINGSLAMAEALGVDQSRGSWIVASYPYVLTEIALLFDSICLSVSHKFV